MRPACRRTCANLHVPVEQTTLLYKEVPDLARSPWCQEPAGPPEFFPLGPGAAARNLAAGECGVSW
jgi:hypothetical protein